MENPALQLAMLRRITEMTGALHEAQILQLKMWPLYAFPECMSCEFTWDVVTKTVNYRLKMKPGTRFNKDREKAGLELESSIRQLLGDSWSISITVGRKIWM